VGVTSLMHFQVPIFRSLMRDLLVARRILQAKEEEEDESKGVCGGLSSCGMRTPVGRPCDKSGLPSVTVL
jgi:hypothetical protein